MNTWLQRFQQQLSRQIVADKLPHALLFSGLSGAGQQELAQWLIDVLLCQKPQQTTEKDMLCLQPCRQCKTCQLFASKSYPDHYTVVNEKKTIGVDLIRGLSQFFEKTAHIGRSKTALINKADSMTSSAANALLKTLEEPTANSYIILTTERSDLLLPTIISRCQKIEIRPPVGDSLLAQFGHQGGDAFVNISHLQELSEPSQAIAYNEFRDMVEQYLNGHHHRNQVLSILVDNSQGFRWLERIVVNIMRQQSGWSIVQMNSSQVNVIDHERLWMIYNLIQVANIKLKTLVQVNKQFLSEKLLVDISRIAHEKS